MKDTDRRLSAFRFTPYEGPGVTSDKSLRMGFYSCRDCGEKLTAQRPGDMRTTGMRSAKRHWQRHELKRRFNRLVTQ